MGSLKYLASLGIFFGTISVLATPKIVQFCTDHDIYAQVHVGSKVFLGGDFTVIGECGANGAPTNPRKLANLAVFDLDKEEFLDWHPIPDDGEEDQMISDMTLSADGSKLYLAGVFDKILGQDRTSRSAAIDTNSLRLIPSWQLPLTAGLNILQFQGNILVSGEFQRIGDQIRRGFAQVDGNTGQLLPWNPNLNEVDAMIVNPKDQSLWLVTTSVSNSVALIGFDKNLKPLASHWDLTEFGLSAAALTIQDGFIYAAGIKGQFNGQGTSGIIKLNIATGEMEKWQPELPGVPFLLHSLGDKLIAGPFFSSTNQGLANENFWQISGETAEANMWFQNSLLEYQYPYHFEQISNQEVFVFSGDIGNGKGGFFTYVKN